jgi:hypothetical protein
VVTKGSGDLGKWWLREVWLTEVVTKGTSEKRNHQFREENPQGQARGRTRGTGLAKKEGVSAAWHGSCETKIKEYCYFDIRIFFLIEYSFASALYPSSCTPAQVSAFKCHHKSFKCHHTPLLFSQGSREWVCYADALTGGCHHAQQVHANKHAWQRNVHRYSTWHHGNDMFVFFIVTFTLICFTPAPHCPASFLTNMAFLKFSLPDAAEDCFHDHNHEIWAFK